MASRGWKGLKPSGHYMYRQFNIQYLYVLPTHCIYVFCVMFGRVFEWLCAQHANNRL